MRLDDLSNVGGKAFWSFGGLFLVGTPEQRRMGIKDSHELAWQDWQGSAFFDRGVDDPAGEDYWAYRWAQAYVDFAAGEKRSWLHAMGVRWFGANRGAAQYLDPQDAGRAADRPIGAGAALPGWGRTGARAFRGG
jgi:predicted oxidoreductase